MTKEKKVDNDKLIVLDQKELEELRKMLREAQAEAAQHDPKVIEKIAADTNAGKIDPDKNYVVMSTGKWKTIEEGFKKLAAPVPPQKPAAPGNTPYLVTIIIMTVIGVLAITAFLSVRPDENILVVSGIVFTFLTPITASIMTFMQSRDTHKAVNSRLDQFIETAGKAAFAEGSTSGRHDAEARADVLAAKKDE